MFGPKTIALPSAPGSIGFCPPTAVRLLPTNTTVACSVKKPQFAGGVDQQAIHLAFVKLRVRDNLIAINKFHAALAQLPPDFPAALEMPRHEHQKQFRETARAAAAQFPPEEFPRRRACCRQSKSARPAARRFAAAAPARRACGVHPVWPRQISSCPRCGWLRAGSRLRATARRRLRFARRRRQTTRRAAGTEIQIVCSRDTSGRTAARWPETAGCRDRCARQMKLGQISASTSTMAFGLMMASARLTHFRRSIG